MYNLIELVLSDHLSVGSGNGTWVTGFAWQAPLY